MSKAKMKRVTLHPLLEDGSMDTSVNLYPKTLIDGIIDESGAPVKVLTDVDLDDLKTEIAAEESRAIEAEEALQVNINEEIERASTKEEELKSLIDDEKESIDHIEESLQDEISRSTEEDEALRAAINAEGSRLDGVVASIEGLDERTSDIESSLDTFVVKEEGKGLSTNDFTDDDKSNLNNISDSIKVYNYFYSDGSYIDVPQNARKNFDIREISSKYQSSISYGSEQGIVTVDGINWNVSLGAQTIPIFNSNMASVKLYQTGKPEDMLTNLYGYDSINLETRQVQRYCRVITLYDFLGTFPSNTQWDWSQFTANGRLTLKHDLIRGTLGVETLNWTSFRIIDPTRRIIDLPIKSISNVNLAIDNIKSLDGPIITKANALSALRDLADRNREIAIVFKYTSPRYEPFGQYNIVDVNYHFNNPSSLPAHINFISSPENRPVTVQLTYHSITDLFYNKDQTDAKFLTIESFNDTSKGHEPIYKIGDLTDGNKLEARTAAEVYNILKSFNPQYPQYACAVFVPVGEDSEPVVGDAVPFDSYTLFINQRRPLDTDPITYEYGYKVLSQHKEYWLTKTSVEEITAATEEYVDDGLSTKQDTLISGETIKTINNESILGSGNIDIQGGSGVTIKEVNEVDITPELLQEVYNEVPEILRINSTNDGIQDYELKVSDKNNDYISYTCIIGGIEIELRLENKEGTVNFKTNVLYFMPSNLVNNLYTIQQVDSLLNNKQNTLVSGTNIKTINNESILGEGNIDIQGGCNVSDLYLEFEDEPTQAQLEQIYTQKPDVLRLGTNGGQHVIVLHKSLQSESETRLNYFNIQNGAGDIQVLKIEYSEEDGYIAEPYEWSLDSIVSGTNDGTNWTSLTIGDDTYGIPQGGGSSTDVQINGTSITSNNVANIVTTTAYDATNNHLATMSDIPDVSTKQETLVSGQNIKTINGTSLLGSGDITVSSVGVDKFLNNAQLVSSGSSTTEETVTFSALDTANANFSLLNNNRSFWTTYDTYMAAITGSKLEEITLNVGQAGNIRIYGYDTAIPYSQTNNQLANAAASADTNGYLIMTIAADLGISTYKLDGTDSRVTISSQAAIDSCPPCLGFSRTGDTGLMKYNSANITGEPYRHWAHAGLSGTVIETPDPTNALPIIFKILKTSTDPNAKLVLTMNDNTTYEVTLGSVDIAPVLSSVYKGKKLSILGDSISTYQNQIPSGNPTYYPRGDVNSPEKTWWKKLADALGMTILVNNSWSGSMVTTNNGDAGAGCLTRCQSLHSGSTNPDVIIVWLGINDFNNEVALGTYDGKSAVPIDTTTFREAYGMMLNKILTKYKTSEVWVCTLPQMERNNSAGFPEINENGVPLKDFNDAIVELADAFGVKVLDHNKAGMTYQNMDIYTVDWDSSTSKGLHPNDAGHSLIANNDIRQLDNVVRTRY